MRSFARVALVVSLLAVPIAPTFAQETTAEEEGIPLPPPMDCLRQLRAATADIQAQSAALRAQADQQAATLTQQAANDAQAGKTPGATATASAGLSGNLNKIAADEGAKSDAAPKSDASSTASAPANGDKPAASSTDNKNSDWAGLFGSLPDSIKNKIRDFLGKEVGKLLDSFLGKAQDLAKKYAEELTAKFPGSKKAIDDAVSNAVKSGFGDIKSPLTKLAQEVLVGDAPKSDKPAPKSSGASNGNLPAAPPAPPPAPGPVAPPAPPAAPNGALASDD